MSAVHILNAVAGYLWAVWIWSAILADILKRRSRSGELFLGIFFELRPFALPVLLTWEATGVYMDGHAPGFWELFFFAVNLFCWWVWKNSHGDDDRWKRRGKKLAEKVERQGSRLVVVPAGAS